MAKFLPNVQDEPRPQLARLVLLGAQDVTDVVVGSGALLGFLTFDVVRTELANLLLPGRPKCEQLLNDRFGARAIKRDFDVLDTNLLQIGNDVVSRRATVEQ